MRPHSSLCRMLFFGNQSSTFLGRGRRNAAGRRHNDASVARGPRHEPVRHTGDAHYRRGIHRGEDMYEIGGFIVHFFSMEKVEHLARGYEIIKIEDFEEGELPRKLFLVVLRKENGEEKKK